MILILQERIKNSPKSNSGWRGSKKSTFPVVGRLGCSEWCWTAKSVEAWCNNGGFNDGAGTGCTDCCIDNPMTLTPFTWPNLAVERREKMKMWV